MAIFPPSLKDKAAHHSAACRHSVRIRAGKVHGRTGVVERAAEARLIQLQAQ
jgi:hypothetical protein